MFSKKETIEKFSVSTALIQQALIAKMRRNLDEGTESALGFAGEQVDRMKEQFSRIFTELDTLIASKYEELEKCATDQDEKEAVLERNKILLAWIEQKMSEINSILDM